MTNTLLEKLVNERHERREKEEEKNPNKLIDPISSVPTTGPMEELARELRDYFFGIGIVSYFIPEITVSYKDLKQTFIDLRVTKNYQEADNILQELNNFKEADNILQELNNFKEADNILQELNGFKEGYNNAWQRCQLEIKNIEENMYIMIKKSAPFPKPEEIKGKNSLKETLEILSPFTNMDKLYIEPLDNIDKGAA